MQSEPRAEQDAARRAPRVPSGPGFAFAQRALIAACVVTGIGLVLLLVWYAADLLLLLFAGILVSIPLRRVTGRLQQATSLGHGVSLAIVTLVLLAAVLAVGTLAAGRVGSQANQLASELQSALETLRARLQGYAWAQQIFDRLPSLGELLGGRGGVVSRIGGLASTALGAIVNAVVVVVVGIYVASQPELYASGIKRLLPFHYRGRAAEVLAVLDEALGRWLVGRLVLMLVNGSLTAIALWAIGVPLALTLGVVAGLLNFIPNFGPLIAAVPAVLIAFVQGPQLALYTVAVYAGVQMLDGYVLTPLVDRKSVELPPVLTISAQLLLGVVFGFVGLLVASPLTASAMIAVKMLYVEDVLGDDIMRESVVGTAEQASGEGPDRAASEPAGGA